MYRFFSPYHNLYYFLELARMQMLPARVAIEISLAWQTMQSNILGNNNISRLTKAWLQMLERATRYYEKPEFNIRECAVAGKNYKIAEKVILNKPFCQLKHFTKIDFQEDLPKMLIVAPMAGHHATLLKGTVADMLPFFDICITDWIDAKQVPLEQGSFDMDDYIDYVIEFIKFLGNDINILAVCQPTVPVLAAASIMSQEDKASLPKSLILIGGPIDASKNPTKVNTFATDKPYEWFEQMLIHYVPPNYPGYMRKVFPGFLQLAGFMSLNLERHIHSHIDLFHDLAVEDNPKSQRQINFYDEYFSVMDLPAEFYLQTIREVFQNFDLAKGTLVSRDRKIDLNSITKCALLGIEGEKDDIAGVGQTQAALELCSKIPDNRKQYILQKDVGHYGVFSGSKFREHIVPAIREFVRNLDSIS